jgi:hypothetical protein
MFVCLFGYSNGLFVLCLISENFDTDTGKHVLFVMTFTTTYFMATGLSNQNKNNNKTSINWYRLVLIKKEISKI